MEMLNQLSDSARHNIAYALAVFILVAPLFCVRMARRDRPMTRGVYTIYGRKERSLNRVEKALAWFRII